MREVNPIQWVVLNNKTTLIVADNYRGIPRICFEYDTLITSKKIISRYKEELIFDRVSAPVVTIIKE